MSPLATGWSDTRGPTISAATALGSAIRVMGGAIAPASAAWPGTNLAFALPFQVAGPITVVEAYVLTGTLPGTTAFDLGIYNDTFNLLASLGATNAVNTSNIIQPVGGGAFASPVTLNRGRYYMAMSAASTALTVMGHVISTTVLRPLGVYQMAAHPLPTTFVPATMSWTLLPPINLTTITNTL